LEERGAKYVRPLAWSKLIWRFDLSRSEDRIVNLYCRVAPPAMTERAPIAGGDRSDYATTLAQ
jgi:hypothetical protein